MMKPILGALCVGVLNLAMGASVTLVCPDASSIQVKKLPYNESWRAYEYTSNIPAIGLPGNTLALEGRGGNAVFDEFRYATWTDHILLCWYAGDKGEYVITSIVDLSSLLSHCAFPAAAGSSHDDCTGSFPGECPLVCNLPEA